MKEGYLSWLSPHRSYDSAFDIRHTLSRVMPGFSFNDIMTLDITHDALFNATMSLSLFLLFQSSVNGNSCIRNSRSCNNMPQPISLLWNKAGNFVTYPQVQWRNSSTNNQKTTSVIDTNIHVIRVPWYQTLGPSATMDYLSLKYHPFNTRDLHNITR